MVESLQLTCSSVQIRCISVQTAWDHCHHGAMAYRTWDETLVEATPIQWSDNTRKIPAPNYDRTHEHTYGDSVRNVMDYDGDDDAAYKDCTIDKHGRHLLLFQHHSALHYHPSPLVTWNNLFICSPFSHPNLFTRRSTTNCSGNFIKKTFHILPFRVNLFSFVPFASSS